MDARNPTISTIVAVCVMVLLLNAPCRASIIVTIPNVSIFEDGTGFADVFITAQSLESIESARYEFEITPNSGTDSSLTISGIQGGISGDVFPNYIFPTNIGQAVDPTTPINPGVTTRFIASDGVDLPGGGVPVIPNNALLTRINLQHDSQAENAIGDVFSLSLVQSGGNTQFLDPNGDALSINPSTSGQITIAANPGAGTPAAVPEPGSFVFLTMSLLGGFGWRKWNVARTKKLQHKCA